MRKIISNLFFTVMLLFLLCSCSPGKVVYTETTIYVDSGDGDISISPTLGTTSGDLESSPSPETNLDIPMIPGL